MYHNNGGGQPHHPPQAPAPAQHPMPKGQTHHTGTSPTHSHRSPQTTHERKRQRQAPGAQIRPRQWVGGPIQALQRLPELGPDGGSGPARVAAAAKPHGGSVAHNVEASQHTTQCNTPEPTEAHNETRQHTTAHSTQYNRAKQSSAPQQRRRTTTPPAASTNTSPTPNTQGGGHTHHTSISPTHSHCRPQTRHARGASPRAHDPTPQRQHSAHDTHNNQGHTYTQHRRDASLMHSWEP